MNAEEGFHYRIMGSFMMMKSSDFKACGGFDPNTFLYSEEAIMAERLKKTGKGVWYCPEVAVLHEHSATISTHFDLRIRRKMRLESDCYYFKTYRGLPIWQVSAARVTLFLKDLFGL